MCCDEYAKGKFLLALELSTSTGSSSPDRIIKRFCKLFNKKVKEELTKVDSLVFAFEGCFSGVFYIGYYYMPV